MSTMSKSVGSPGTCRRSGSRQYTQASVSAMSVSPLAIRLDVVHDPEVDLPGDAAGPEVVIPGRVDVQLVPGRAGQGRGAVAVVLQGELAALYAGVAQDLGVARLLRDVEREAPARLPLDDALLEDAGPG